MIKGMTGYGSDEISNGKIKAVMEIKSLNHRYFDITYYLPTGLSFIEDKMRQMIQKEIERGRITISMKITQKPRQAVVVNRDAVKTHLTNAKAIAKTYKIQNDLTLSDLFALPGVLELKETLVDAEMLWPSLEKSLRRALKSLMVMKTREGRSLFSDLKDKLNRMSLQISKIQARQKALLSEKKQAMTNEEYLVYQKSSDIHEELTRLIHYIDEIKALLKASVAVGKRMDFIAQEMQRETNTIGSKLQDKVVSNGVISLKSKIEKIREQAQNIE